MDNSHDLELIIRSRIPIIIIQSHEERRVLDMVRRLAAPLAAPVFRWAVTEGLQRLDGNYGPQRHASKPADVLGHIKSVDQPGIYALLDFHPWLDDPVHVRLLKDIAIGHEEVPRTVILLSHDINAPTELRHHSAEFHLALPDEAELRRIVSEVSTEWSNENFAGSARVDATALDLLVKNLAGLTVAEARRLARHVIYDDGALGHDDLPKVMRAKYSLLNREGVLSYEYDTAQFSDVGGMRRLRQWLELRRDAFHGQVAGGQLERPRGVLLLGVQGCGKSLAAKATAGLLGAPLLRLDFGSLYNKFHGETERNLRESLDTAEVMAPCVLWMDEIEKGLSSGEHDGGTSRRVLATFLTWMAERQAAVFLVATANDITALPPELVRKGRFDEIFFVDLPDMDNRRQIFEIHLGKRGADPSRFELEQLALASEGFSGAEIEQVVVSAIYLAHGQSRELSSSDLLTEINRTRPLSVTMAEKIHGLRAWAADRTVPSD